MKILIVEDEKLAREYLIGLIGKLPIHTNVVGQPDSVKEAIKWLLKNEEPNLIFMDIDLGDGLCFEIFEVIDVKCPVVFITAFDEYAIKAFQVNSIDYLLKPVDQKDIEKAISKYESIKGYHNNEINYRAIDMSFSAGFKERFIIKVGDHLKTLPIGDILFIKSERKSTYIHTKEGRNYPVDYSLDKLKDLLDPANFLESTGNIFYAMKLLQIS